MRCFPLTMQEYARYLKLKEDTYFFNDGTQTHLLKIDGVLPIYYLPRNGERFNIPIQIWLTPSFPYEAPLAFVKPTADMQINPRCKIVDPNGQIWTECLKNWEAPNSTLLDVVVDMQIEFGQITPVCAKSRHSPSPSSAPQYHPNTSPPRISNDRPEVVTNPLNRSSLPVQAATSISPPKPWYEGVLGAAQQQKPAMMQDKTVKQQYYPPPIPSSSNGNIPVQSSSAVSPLSSHHAQHSQALRAKKQERDVSFRIALSRALSTKLAAALEADIGIKRSKQLEIKRELEDRASKLTADVSELQKERDSIDSAAFEISEANKQLAKWLEENEPRALAAQEAAQGDINPDLAIAMPDILSEHLLIAQAAELASRDVMEALDKAFSEDLLPLDAYLKQIREFGRRQFIARALHQKVESKQRRSANYVNVRNVKSSILTSGDVHQKPSEGQNRHCPVVVPSHDIGVSNEIVEPDDNESFNGVDILLNPLAKAARNMRTS